MWFDNFIYNPIDSLLHFKHKAVSLLRQRDLLDKTIIVENIRQLQEPQKILSKQNKNNWCEYAATKEIIRSKENYNQLEAFRNLGFIMEEFGFTKKNSAIENGAEYIFTFQTEEGDFRGISKYTFRGNKKTKL
jgi:hypothetical protein